MNGSLRRRNSGIELLKILAILLIVISHVTQTITMKPLPELMKAVSSMKYNYFLDLGATEAPIPLTLIFFRGFGNLGNALFFICSAWFLCDSRNAKLSKVISMASDIWLISVIFLAIYRVRCPWMPKWMVKQSLLPTMYMTNWYMTAYLMIYSVHRGLNVIIESMDRKAMTALSIVLFFIFNIVCSLSDRAYFMNNLICFFEMYFIVACLKKHYLATCDKRWLNWLTLLLSALGYVSLILISNRIGLHDKSQKKLVVYWIANQNPFIFIAAFSLFNLFRRHEFHSAFINRIASLTMIIYLTHENILFRRLERPVLLNAMIRENPQFSLITDVLLFALGLFLAAVVVSWLYDVLIGKWVNKLSSAVSRKIVKVYDSI